MPYLITIIIYFFSQNIAFSAPLKDFTTRYDLYYNGFYVGKSSRALETKNNLATFSSIAKTAGMAALFANITVTENSKLRYVNNSLNFFSYLYDEKGNDKNEKYELHLDKTLRLYNSHEKKFYPATKNLHDTLGFTVAIMLDMQAGKRNIKYTIAEKDNFKPYTLKFIQKEVFRTDKGEISTLKMEHYDPETKYRFTFWCAEDMGFLPIKISNINPKGDENSLILTHFNHNEINLNFDNEDSE